MNKKLLALLITTSVAIMACGPTSSSVDHSTSAGETETIRLSSATQTNVDDIASMLDVKYKDSPIFLLVNVIKKLLTVNVLKSSLALLQHKRLQVKIGKFILAKYPRFSLLKVMNLQLSILMAIYIAFH